MKKTALVAVLTIGVALSAYHVRRRMLVVHDRAAVTATSASSTTQSSPVRRPLPEEPQSEIPVDEIEAAVVQYAKALPASKLNASLPNKPFEAWLKETLGPDAKLEWQSNDCGEFDGSGRQTSVPLCADARAEFPDGRRMSVWIVVGSLGLGSAKPEFSKEPAVWWATVSSRKEEVSCRLQLSYLKDVLEAESSSADAMMQKWCGGHLPPG